MIQCLFCFSVDEVLISVGWIEDGGVMRRIIKDDGTWFERASDRCTLTEEWSDEGLYFGYGRHWSTLWTRRSDFSAPSSTTSTTFSSALSKLHATGYSGTNDGATGDASTSAYRA